MSADTLPAETQLPFPSDDERPARQTALEPGEAIGVRVLLESISKDSERANMVLEVTGVRFD